MPATSPQTAIWHFGWHVTDARKSLEMYRNRPDVKLLPLYTSSDGESVFISSDTWPGKEGVLGYLVGQVMKETQGKANPKVVNELLRERLKA